MLGSYAVGSRQPEMWLSPSTPVVPIKQRKSFGFRYFKKSRIGKRGKGLVATRPTLVLSDCEARALEAPPKIAYSDDINVLNSITSPASSTDTLVNVPYSPPTPQKPGFVTAVTKAIQGVIDPDALIADESFFTDGMDMDW
ncbi:hypothetical protein HWV62_21522 [Athelia sp. TMB]|nr:hypothetical protein HWV62_21522 [Athelia sp. TMB]